MPRSPAGVYTPPSGTYAVSLQTISSPAYNNFLNDISQAITASLCTSSGSGGNNMSQLLYMGGNPITGLPYPPQADAAANKLYVDSQSSPGGFLNKLRNGTFDVWQRGSGPISVGSLNYGPDGWQFFSSGVATVSLQIVAGRALTTNACKINGATGLTDTQMLQRIESYIAAPLANAPVTFQAWIYNGHATAIAPNLLTYHLVSRDVFSGATLDNSIPLQSCAPGVWTRVAYTFIGHAASALGVQVLLDFPVSLASGEYVAVSECDLRVTPGLSAGLNAIPPPAEFRPIAVELGICQRYFESSYDLGLPLGAVGITAGASVNYFVGLPSSAYAAGVYVAFKNTKRADPTVTTYSTTTGAIGKARDAQNSADVTTSAAGTGESGFFWSASASAASGTINLQAQWSASAEL